MIILDTNVISEMMRPTPAPQVQAWFAANPASSLFTTALTKAEILYGLALLPAGKRRNGLHAAALSMFDEDLAGRVLPFDSEAASIYPALAAERRKAGKPISQLDAQIAAIARSRGAAVATRDSGDFADCGLMLVDPWTTR
jgi:predicted nucleic acid-binding protein